jgi:hypothetical protein
MRARVRVHEGASQVPQATWQISALTNGRAEWYLGVEVIPQLGGDHP